MSDANHDRNRRVEDYIRGQADEDAARQLEIEMLDDDELFERIQTDALLKRGLEENDRAAPARVHVGGTPPAPMPRLAWALAASFGAVAMLLGVYSLKLNERIETLQSPSTGLPVITLFEQRSLVPDVTDPAVQLAGHAGPVLLEIDVSGYRSTSFQLELVGDEGSIIWEAQTPDERGYLNLLAPRARALKAINIRSPDGELLKSYQMREE